MSKILVVEDEADVRLFLVEALEQEGHEVSEESDGADALGTILANKFDLIVLDVSLPTLDGFVLLKEVRKTSRVPVLILTARRRVEDRVEGLETGADDYLTKPFELSEFLARVKSVLRRSEASRGIIEIGDLWLDPVSRKAKRGQRPIYFSNTEILLLETLCHCPGEPVSKQDLLKQVWGDDDTRAPNLVEVYIGYLRTKLEMGGRPRMIHTMRGQGYVITDPGARA